MSATGVTFVTAPALTPAGADETLAKPPRTAIKIATRGSPLALWQARYVTGLLAQQGVAAELLVLKTTADRIQDRFLHEIGGKGLFVKELEEALLDGRADMAVHSLKDMPAHVQEPFSLAALLPRHAPTDVLILRADIAAKLPKKAALSAADVASYGNLTVGTGSLRRQAILRQAAPNFICEGVRGNVDTRLAKLAAGSWDALILAEASLDRLAIHDVERRRLLPDWFIPCAGQGALALEARAGDSFGLWLDAAFGCPETRLAIEIERGLLAMLGGDCTLPFGCHVSRMGQAGSDGYGEIRALAAVYGPAGEKASVEHRAPIGALAAFDRRGFLSTLAARLHAAGVGPVLKALGLQVPAAFA